MVCFRGIIWNSIESGIGRANERRFSIGELPLLMDEVSKPCITISQGDGLILIDRGLQLEQVLLDELLV